MGVAFTANSVAFTANGVAFTTNGVAFLCFLKHKMQKNAHYRNIIIITLRKKGEQYLFRIIACKYIHTYTVKNNLVRHPYTVKGS